MVSQGRRQSDTEETLNPVFLFLSLSVYFFFYPPSPFQHHMILSSWLAFARINHFLSLTLSMSLSRTQFSPGALNWVLLWMGITFPPGHLSPFVEFIILLLFWSDISWWMMRWEKREREVAHFLTQCGHLQLTLLQWEDYVDTNNTFFFL